MYSHCISCSVVVISGSECMKLFSFVSDSKILYPVETNKSLIQLQETLEHDIFHTLHKPAVSSDLYETLHKSTLKKI